MRYDANPTYQFTQMAITVGPLVVFLAVAQFVQWVWGWREMGVCFDALALGWTAGRAAFTFVAYRFRKQELKERARNDRVSAPVLDGELAD